MNSHKFWAAMGKILAAVTVTLIAILILSAGASAANSEKVLYSFTGGADGADPHSLIFDQAGNLYGTTTSGGIYGAGTVYSLTPNGDGTWKQTVVHSFTGGSDGGAPDWNRLAFDAAGNLYGATYIGGNSGEGTVFKLTPNPDGSWTENVLHQFTGGKDGGLPRTTPIFGAAQNLYGTSSYGGADGCGTVFKMTPSNGDRWSYRVIHQFMDKPACSPWVGLIPDKAGSLYGTTRNTVGGCGNPPYECGTVFKLTPNSDGKWTHKVIHKFSGGKGGSDPSVSGLVFDEAGTLYGTTEHAGAHESGVFFKLAPGVSDKWIFRVLHPFSEKRDGSCPTGHVVRDPAGNLYGTACLGGAYGNGTVYKMTPNSDGTWTFSVLYNFSGGDGANPIGGPILDAAGDLYGVTGNGGAYGYGVVYEITP